MGVVSPIKRLGYTPSGINSEYIKRNAGFRMDFILLSASLTPRLERVGVDKGGLVQPARAHLPDQLRKDPYSRPIIRD